MKRGAEKQMTKAGREDLEEAEDEEPQRGFAKADDTVLATRKIRALPRRSQPSTALAPSVTNGAEAATTTTPHFTGFAAFGNTATAPAPTLVTNGTETSASTTSRFTGFVGFGNAPAGSTPFSFVPPSKSFSLPPTAPMSPPTSVFGNPTPPSVAPSASSAAKSLATFLTPPASAPASPAPSPARPAQKEKSVDENLDGAVNYYCSLRGLNHSFLSAITSTLDEDPFINLSQVFDSYKSTWQKIQKDFDEHNATAKSRTEGTPGAPVPGFAWTTTKPTTPEPPKETPKPTSSFAGFSESKPSGDMPKPPTAFAGFPPVVAMSGGPKPPGFVPLVSEKEKEKSTTTPSSGGFTFPSSSSAASTSSPFIFGGSASSASPNPFALPDTTKSASAPTAAFGNKAASSTTSVTKSAFGGGAFGSSSLNPFSVPDSSKPTASYIGPSSFSFKPSTSDSGTSAPKAELSNPFGAPSSSFGSGGSSTVAKFGTSETKTTTFTFGSSGSTPASGPASTGTGSFFGFGTGSGGSGSIGNPVGFGFGTLPTPKPLEAEGSGSLTEEENSQGSLGGEEDPAKFAMTSNLHDEEGEGEEDEETLHHVRTKVYKLLKHTGTTKWVTAGLGKCILRLKKHKDTGARRLLLRNSSNGKININFNIYSGMSPTLDKVFVSFIGHEADGSSITYKAKLKSEQDAAELRDAIEREVQSLKE